MESDEEKEYRDVAINGMALRCGRLLIDRVLVEEIDIATFVAITVVLKPFLYKNLGAVAENLSDNRIVEIIPPPITFEKLNEYFDSALIMVAVRSMKDAGLKKYMKPEHNLVDN